jgi:hypothetical protein
MAFNTEEFTEYMVGLGFDPEYNAEHARLAGLAWRDPLLLGHLCTSQYLELAYDDGRGELPAFKYARFSTDLEFRIALRRRQLLEQEARP